MENYLKTFFNHPFILMTIMKKFIFLPLLGLILLTGCIKEFVSGSGAIISEKRTISGRITAIQVEGSINVRVQQGDSTQLSVKDYENLLLYLDTRIVGTTLVVEYRDAWVRHTAGEITLVVPQLSDITIEGSSDVSTIGNFNFEDLSINISGSGSAFLAGTAKNTHIKISGSGDIRAFEMPTDNSKIIISGSGAAQLNVKKQLDINISGSGDLIYKGDPSVSSRISGSGKVRKF